MFKKSSFKKGMQKACSLLSVGNHLNMKFSICNFSSPMTMATEETQSAQARPSRSNLLRKQSEIEEVEEEDTSPGSDQSDTTITAGKPDTFNYSLSP